MATLQRKRNSFGKLGGFIVRRKYLIIVAWIIALVVAYPISMNSSKVISLQQGSSTGQQLESIQASNIINAQFAKSVPNSSLVIVISAQNVSSPQTQAFVANTISKIKSNSSIVGLQNITSVYSVLDPILNSTNKGAFEVYHSANKTNQLLLGVPALYIGVWVGAFNQTHSVQMSNQIAYQQSAKTLSSGNQTAFNLYSSHVLDFFNASWAASWQNPSYQNYTILQRGSLAANQSNAEYVMQYMTKSRDFGIALVRSFTLAQFLSNDTQSYNSSLASFAVRYLANTTGLSTSVVNSTFQMGQNFTSSTLDRLSGNMVWSPDTYQVSPQIDSLISSFTSQSKNTTLITIGLNQSSDKNLIAIRSILHSVLVSSPSSGVYSAMVTGDDALNYDFGASTQNDLSIILPVTIILLLVATGIFFRSVLTPFITLGTIGVALGIAQVFIVLVGTFVAKVDFTVPTILVTILIGVGTDYSVFIIARYREERVRGLAVQEAIEKSVTWAGESIATSGATVIISFLSLSVTTIVFLRTMGVVVGLGVLVALSIALTLVPAILASIGGKAFWPNSGKRFAKYAAAVLDRLERKRGYFSKSGAFSVKRAKVLILVAFLLTLPALYVYLNTVPTYDFLGGAPANLESIAASHQMTQSFGGGRLSPTYVVVTFSQPVWNGSAFSLPELDVVKQMSSYLVSHQDIQNVTSPTMPYGQPISYSSLNASVSSDNRTIHSMLQSIGSDNKTVLITINLRIDPYSTQAINDAQDIRSHLHQNFDSAHGVTGIYEGGASGSILDTRDVVGGQFNSILPIVALGVAIVLLVVLGSVFLPIFAVISVLMSIVWTLAVTKFVFQTFFNYGVLFITPLFLFVTLLGLGMDYNIFILTRIREEASNGQKLDDAIVHAIEHTGGIITAAAVILAGSLAALMLSNDLLLKEIGFAFSFSILVDALVVRTYLVPAVMSSLGRWNWYNPIPFLKRSRALFEKKD